MAEFADLAKVQLLTEPRKKKLRARLGECDGLDGWDAALGKIAASKFLCGDNDRGWRADFDFLLQQKSFAKLLEGAYDHRPGTQCKEAGLAAAFDRLAEEDARK